MSDNQIVDSSFTAIINAPIGKIDIPTWCFSLPEREYQGCSPAHIAAGFTTAPDGKRMSVNVEITAVWIEIDGDANPRRCPADPEGQ